MRKAKKTEFSIAKESKRMSRERFGFINRGRVIVSKKYRKKPKYKPDYLKELKGDSYYADIKKR